jgi:hypothetical protein
MNLVNKDGVVVGSVPYTNVKDIAEKVKSVARFIEKGFEFEAMVSDVYPLDSGKTGYKFRISKPLTSEKLINNINTRLSRLEKVLRNFERQVNQLSYSSVLPIPTIAIVVVKGAIVAIKAAKIAITS